MKTNEKGALLITTAVFFVLCFSCAVLFKWAVDSCININPMNRIFTQSIASEQICKPIKSAHLEALSQLPQLDDSSSGSAISTKFKIAFYPALLFSLIPSDKGLILVTVLEIAVLSLILGSVLELVFYFAFRQNEPPTSSPYRRRKTATFKIMKDFSNEGKDWKSFK